MLIEVHIIQNHAPSNLNRDDSGSPKSAMFGGYRRARISSQCLKRCYRTSQTFRSEVDDLGMHTRSMPDEVKRRLLQHARTVTDPVLKGKFEEWAEKSQPKLAAILGKGSSGGASKADEAGETEAEESAGSEVPQSPDEGGEEGAAEVGSGKPDKHLTAQSIFWREAELQALFSAYKERIEWDKDVPETMRNAFDAKGKVNVKKIVKVFDSSLEGTALGEKIAPIKWQRDSRHNDLDQKYPARDDEIENAKSERGKKLKEGKAKADEEAARALEQLLVDRMEPKVILRDAGLRPEGIPVDMGLFGRMIASPLMHNVEASSQFAHALSTHEWQREFDLWTRVDDRRDKRLDFYKSAFGAEEKLEAGTDGMGDQEFTSACYYSYFNVNFDALVDNLTGKALKHDLDDSPDREGAQKRACNAVAGLIKAAILERPTGKFNSMATPSLPTLVVVEVREEHVAVSYADAFAKPVDAKGEEKLDEQGRPIRVDLPKESAKRLIEEANRITKAFSRKAKARLVFTAGHHLGAILETESVPAETVDSLDDLIAKVKNAMECPADNRE